MISLRPRRVRTRMTLWYVSVLAGVLILYACGTSLFLYFNLRSELDRNLIRDFEMVQSLLEMAPDGTIGLKEHYHEEEEFDGGVERLLEVWSLEGRLLYRSEEMSGLSLGNPPTPEEGRAGMVPRSKRLLDGTRVRMLTALYNIEGRWMLIRLAHSEERLWHELGKFIGMLLVGLPLALLLTALAGYALAHRTLSPIDKMTRKAEKISAEHLNERLPIGNPDDELGHLAQVFNAMLTRIQRSFEQLRRFTADASHELRTPLTALRRVGEVGLQNSQNLEHHRDAISSMLEEVDRMTRLVDSLLFLSRADAEQIQLKKESISLYEIARDACGLLSVLAEEKNQHLEILGEQNLTVLADRTLLRQALVNLVDNAIKYSPKGGSVRVQVKKGANDEAIGKVIDSGPGITQEHREKVFERFYRVDKARSRELGGAGLGLAITKWTIQAHGGHLELESEAGGGSVFRIFIPC